MSGGIGKIQHKIIDTINWYKEDCYKEGFCEQYDRKGLPIDMLMYMVYFGFDYWDRIDKAHELYEEGLWERTYGKLTESQKQVIWRAVRSLQKRGLITRYRNKGDGGIEAESYYDSIKLNV